MSFPQAATGQAYVKVSAIDAGELTLQEKFFVTDPAPGARATVPSLSFLIQHGDKKVLFDGGLRHSPDDYKKEIAERIRSSLEPYIVKTDAAEFLLSKGCDPHEISAVILSHVHYDHIGRPESFPTARYVVGAGSTKTMQEGSPGYEISLFESDLFEQHEVVELPPSPASDAAISNESIVSKDPNHFWRPLGHFPAALDYFGDGSLWIIDAPGHMEGHINLLARTGPSCWIYLGGDSCHDPRILSGEKGIAEYNDAHGNKKCAHTKKEAADETVARIRQLLGMKDFEVILAHDHHWYANNKHRFFPNLC
jgi:glyoxylase-like metal-dependent hydrolase (beta-lactamase superfamily II)